MIVRKSKHEFKVSLGDTGLVPYTPMQLHEVLEWCQKNFGKGGRSKKYKWRYGWIHRDKDTFYFRQEKDALYFVLRWT